MGGYFTRSIIKTPVSPSQSGSVSTVTLVSPGSPWPSAVPDSVSLHPFLPEIQPVTSATLAVTHHRYPRDRLHENITPCDRFQEMKSGRGSELGLPRPGENWPRSGVNSVSCHLDFRVRYNIGTILSLSADYNLLKSNLSGGDRFNYHKVHIVRSPGAGGEI